MGIWNKNFTAVCLIFLILMQGCGNSGTKNGKEQIQPADKKAVSSEETAVPTPPPPVSPLFDFTQEDFSRKIIDPAEEVLQNPGDFLELAADLLKQPEWTLQLVDKSHFLAPDFVPPELVLISDYPDIRLNSQNIKLSKAAAESLNKMSKAAAEENINLIASSAYRSWNYQKNLFARYAEASGEEEASRYAAREGASQHQLGTTVDFNSISSSFAYSQEYKWMQEHAGEFGWSLSYPEGKEEETGYIPESWHWRWLGKSALKMQKDYFHNNQYELLEFWNKNKNILRDALIENQTL